MHVISILSMSLPVFASTNIMKHYGKYFKIEISQLKSLLNQVCKFPELQSGSQEENKKIW